MMMDVFIRGLGAIRRVNGSQPVEWRTTSTVGIDSLSVESVTIASTEWNFDGVASFFFLSFFFRRTRDRLGEFRPMILRRSEFYWKRGAFGRDRKIQ